jgi:dimethylargininase
MLLALTRPVPPSIAHCELTHLAREPIDVARAEAQHDAYEDALRAIGCTVQRLAVLPEHPDSVFIEDTAVVLDECAVIMRPGAESRRGEVPAVATALSAHRRLCAIEAPATLDGGDVLVAGRRVFVGRSSRTNDEGVRQLTRILAPHGYTVTAIPVTRCLHLKSAASALGDGRVLYSRALVDPGDLDGVTGIAVDASEPLAANVVGIGRAVLCAVDAPMTRRTLEREGFDVHAVDGSELAKAEGGLTCCSLLFSVRESDSPRPSAT